MQHLTTAAGDVATRIMHCLFRCMSIDHSSFLEGYDRRIMRAMKSLAVVMLMFVVGCSGSSPTAPTPPPPVVVMPPVVSPPVVVTPPVVTPPPAFPPNDTRFDLTLYRKLVHNAYEGPLQPLRRFSQSPRIYLRTVDEDGKAIDSRMLDQTAKALDESAREMTGKFGLAGIERGTDRRLGLAGWLTVQWLPQASNPRRICGQAHVGLEGGTIDLFPYQQGCGCEMYGLSPRLVRHELGHALGYWHTDDPRDLMYNPRFGAEWEAWRPACNVGMSAREIYHAAVAYDRPIGSAAP